MRVFPGVSAQAKLLSVIVAITVATFIVDLSTPRGVAAGVFPYFFSIYLSSRLASDRAPLIVAGVATILTLIGFFATTGGRGDIILFNRAFIIVTLWIMAVLARDRIRKNEEIAVQRGAVDSAQQFRDLISNSQLGIQIVGFDGPRLLANKALTDLLGYESPEEYLSRPRGSVIAPYHLERGVTLEKIRAQRLPPSGSVELDMQKKDGSTVPVQMFWRTITWAGVTALLRTFVDISERRRHERETLEREKTVQNLRGELARASRVSAMGEVSTVIAHELHQPLTAITATAGAARRRLRDETARSLAIVREEMIPLIIEQADRAGRVISGIRTLFEGGMPEWSHESIDEIVAQTCVLVASEFRTANICYDRKDENRELTVLVDKVQVQQVIFNLLRNAVEASRDSARQDVEVVVKRTGERKVEVSVRDSGVGVPPEFADRLFEPFTTSKERGMGMGLFTCKTIVESYGGKIRAEPGPDGGTIMRFWLPLEKQSVLGGRADPAGEALIV